MLNPRQGEQIARTSLDPRYAIHSWILNRRFGEFVECYRRAMKLAFNALEERGRDTGMKRKSIYQPLKHSVALLAMGLMAFAVAMADAQRGTGGPRMSQEDREAAWTLEAKGVAHDIGASGEESGKIVTAYIAARASHGAAMREARENSGGGRGNFQAYRAITTKERDTLSKALAEIVSTEKAAAATESLGTFNNQWDRMASAVAAFGLAEEKQNACLTMIAKHVVTSDKVRREAFANQDFQSFRVTSQEQKSALDEQMAAQLSEEQLATWKERTTRRRGPGGRRPGN